MKIRNAISADFEHILALNQAFVHFTSELDLAKVTRLDQQSCYHKVVDIEGQLAAFLLVFDQHADYSSPNYTWFKNRYSQFLYIDRVVVSQQLQSAGLGRSLYQDLFEFAGANNYDKVCCEFNLKPANPTSAKFHQGFGFQSVGEQTLAADKLVSMQVKALT